MIHHPLVCAVLTVSHKWLLNQCSPAEDRATLPSHVAYHAESNLGSAPALMLSSCDLGQVT